MERKHRVCIVGGGFAGMNVAKGLRNAPVEVTLVDRRNFHLFQPLLYQVATAGLSAGDIASPLRHIFRNDRNVKVLLGEVIGFDVQARKVILTDGECEYDTLVLALGTQNSYFGNDKWATVAPGLKSVEEATEIRRRIFFAFEMAERQTELAKRDAWMTFLIVGAGPTGVELAGTLGEIANDTLKGDFRVISPECAKILLVDGGDRMLSTYPEELSVKAEKQILGLGVRFRPNVRVTDIDEDGVALKGPNGIERIPAKTVLWAAGVAPSPLGRKLAEQTGAETSKPGHVHVNKDCTVPGHPEIFMVGDMAWFDGEDGKPLPGVAPVAIQQGSYVAKVIRKRLKGEPVPLFKYWDKGSLATIGRRRAVGLVGGFKISGVIAWLAWLFIHLAYLVEFQNRILVLMQWGFQYLTFNRGARLITGASRMIQNAQLQEAKSTTKV